MSAKRTRSKRLGFLIGGALIIKTAPAHAAPFLGVFTENFNSMGAAGTAPPAGWTMKLGEAGTGNTTWTSSITANGVGGSVASMVNAATPLTASNAPAANANNGYNAGAPGDATNRMLATAPTTVSGSGIELVLTNSTGSAINDIALSYDTQRFTSVGTVNELPGYQLFYSLNGTSWTNVTPLNPTIATVPNSAGVTNTPLTGITLSGVWNDGANLQLRWIDDNAQQTSPDQIIGLDNVNVVPEPMGLAAGALLIPMFVRRSRREVTR